MIVVGNLDARVRFTGVLNRDEMTWCYRNCSAFLMTSRVEACPNIALEAMGHGCLCVSTSNPPMPEIFQDTALYYPAGDAEALAQKVLHSLQLSGSHREVIRRFAVARAAEFTWEACCDHTVCELQKVLTR
jgi:glycosyltransferase involved in cell wall biosynthesis